MITLGLDIGSNSVGSAWVDLEQEEVRLGVSIFPAGVDETDTKRGTPVNQRRREKRSQRRNIARRAMRKRNLRRTLTDHGLLPSDESNLRSLWEVNPWELRRAALSRELTPHEFGRVLTHLNQRRGALGVETDPDDPDEGKVKEAIDRLRQQMAAHQPLSGVAGNTVGRFMADRYDERVHRLGNGENLAWRDPIRNRRDVFEFHADRGLIRAEFETLWQKQTSFGGALSRLLTEELKARLDQPSEDDTWRHKGAIFGQRRTYWDMGTLGRCDLEPTDERCPLGDMYAQEFRVLETVNNIRATPRGGPERELTGDEKRKVIDVLRKQKSGTPATVRKALGFHGKEVKAFWSLNVEKDAERSINTDWFYREIVLSAIGEAAWRELSPAQRGSINRAILKFDPEQPAHAEKLRAGARMWWRLDEERATRLVDSWKGRPKVKKRISLSRRAIQNLLPYMQPDHDTGGLDVTRAKLAFAEDADNGADEHQRQRYATAAKRISKADRRFMRKHPDLLPPAPTLANPVVRKAIHEVRRHLIAHRRKSGRWPDRIVVELARSATQPEHIRNEALARNRKRNVAREAIAAEFGLDPRAKGVERVLLCRQQRLQCAYSGETITERMAAIGASDDGRPIETDHIVPLSRSQDNGLNNKVLCFIKANRGKGNQTPREWLSAEQFADVEQRLRHLELGDSATDYFTKRDCSRKWENLHRDAPAAEEFHASQLSDTAYASKQVVQWLRDTLYSGEVDGQRRVFTTKGSYTAILRRDWRLFQSLRRHVSDPTEAESLEQSRAQGKDRGDHRHHAIDAVVIALTGPERIRDLAHHAEAVEIARAQSDISGRPSLANWPRREPLPPPWGSIEEFRRAVLSKVFEECDKSDSQGRRSAGVDLGTALIVAHRPVKRKLIGYFHKEDLWGEVDESQGVFRIRCNVADLKPATLRMPVEESDKQLRDRVISELVKAGISEKDAKKESRKAVESGRFKRKFVDPSLGKGGLVRDWELRRIIRDCLQFEELDPDHFTDKQIKDLANKKNDDGSHKIRMPSGVPIKSVITIGPISDPVKIAVKDGSSGRQAINQRTGKPLFRYHISRNNHHIEIREDAENGRWLGAVVRTFDAVRRVRPQKNADGSRARSQPAVDKTDRDGNRFVMSLAEGETVCMRDPDSGRPGYFVLFKIDRGPDRLHFTRHWDARASKATEEMDARDDVNCTPADFKRFEPEHGRPPYKVAVGPLGDTRPMVRD